MASFVELEFPRNIDRGPSGGPSFLTTVVVTASGAEQRIAAWTAPRYAWQVGHSLRTPAQYQELLAFFIARRGRLEGFRFWDWSDHSSEVAGVETLHLTASLTATTFQLQKGYASGAGTVYRTITKPVGDTLTDTAATDDNSTVRIYNAADVEVTSGWTVDLTTGIVTFAAAPGYTPKATFQFHIPVRFDTDQMAASIDEVTYRTWSGVPLTEVRT
jgi:uncharacterized protein (TIGR02217 family)